MPDRPLSLDWADIAFGGKRVLTDLHATFILAPRILSVARIKTLIKTYLPKGNIVLGVSKEPYVDGYDKQPQFTMLRLTEAMQHVIDSVNQSVSSAKIYILEYSQRDTKYILEKGGFKQVVLVNGSWRHAFHHSEAFYVISSLKTPFEYVSPFNDISEARAYETSVVLEMQKLSYFPAEGELLTESAVMDVVARAAAASFDYTYQTGVVLAKRLNTQTDRMFRYITHAYNKVVPFQSYALHFGSVRERHFSPVNDLNYYDTVHAEVMMLIEAQKKRIDLTGTTVFINLLPCPHCSRMFTQTDVSEFIYSEDHSNGFAIQLLEDSGKTVRRLVHQL